MGQHAICWSGKDQHAHQIGMQLSFICCVDTVHFSLHKHCTLFAYERGCIIEILLYNL